MFYRNLIAVLVLSSGLSTAAHAEMVRKSSPHSVAATADRIEAAATAKGMTVFGRVDHSGGAAKAGLELKPMLLVMFGNPKGGTPLIQAEPGMGLSLPLKVLIWEDAAGQVQVAYDPPADLATLRGLDPAHPALGKVAAALEAITSEAVAP